MKCTDCSEPITETERRTHVACEGCNAPLHAECAMTDSAMKEHCEPCHEKAELAYRSEMFWKGMEA